MKTNLEVHKYSNPTDGIVKDTIVHGVMLCFMEPNETECHPAKFKFVDTVGQFGPAGQEVTVTTSPVVRLLKKLTNPKTGGGYYEFLTQGKDGLHRYILHDWRGE